jgi:hypothetical protein
VIKTPAAPILVFKTTDGREFTSEQVKQAIVDNKGSNRGAGRTLGVGESTIRGWRAKGDF